VPTSATFPSLVRTRSGSTGVISAVPARHPASFTSLTSAPFPAPCPRFSDRKGSRLGPSGRAVTSARLRYGVPWPPQPSPWRLTRQRLRNLKMCSRLRTLVQWTSKTDTVRATSDPVRPPHDSPQPTRQSGSRPYVSGGPWGARERPPGHPDFTPTGSRLICEEFTARRVNSSLHLDSPRPPVGHRRRAGTAV